MSGNFDLAKRPNFGEELMIYLVDELGQRGYDTELIHEKGHIDVYLEDIKVGILLFHEEDEPYLYNDNVPREEGLYFIGGQLNYDHDEVPRKIDLVDQDFVDRVAEHIESRRIYIDSERTNIKLPEGYPPIVRPQPEI